MKLKLSWLLFVFAASFAATFGGMSACKQAPTLSPDAAPLPVAPVAVEPDIVRQPRPEPPKASPDTRSAAEIAQAACTAPDGGWRCSAARPKTYKALGTTPIIPASWTVPAWFIDPANSSGTASDQNDCVTLATPCVTYQEIAIHRWGTYSPRLRQNTVITAMSNWSGTADPIYFFPYIEGGVVSIQGVLGAAQQVATGVLSNVTAKNQTSGVGTMLLAQSGATAPGQLVVNTTHASRAWTYAVSAGAIFKMSQPLAPVSIPITSNVPAEVNTWANGDSVTVYSPVSVNVGGLGAFVTEWNAGLTNLLTIYQISIAAPAAFDSLQMQGGMLNVAESQINRVINMIPEATTLSSAFINDDFTSVWHGAGQTSQQTFVSGGQFRATSSDCVSCSFRRGVVIGSIFNAYNTCSYDDIFVDVGKTFNIQAGVFTQFPGATVWGLGTLNVTGNTRFQYIAGAGSAATEFTISTLQLNSQTKGCLAVPSAATAYDTCNIAVTAANLDANLGATSGCIGTPNGGAFCNY